MAPRTGVMAFGSAAALVVLGGTCTLVIAGLNGRAIAVALVSLGLGGAVLLVFLEVGLSEDRDRAKGEERRRKRAAKRAAAQRRRPRVRRPRRPV